jgi:hypothetical protein
MGPTALLPLRRKACGGFYRPKNPTALAGCEPANLVTKGQHATSRPPKPEQVWTCNVTLHVHTFSGRNRIIPFDATAKYRQHTEQARDVTV